MFDKQAPRRVVPRWRPSRIAAQTAEAWTHPPPTSIDFKTELANKRLELKHAESVPIASELMFLALQAGNLETARVAARQIVNNESSIGVTRLVSAAKKILDSSDLSQMIAPTEDFVREARKRLALSFRNPILLMDVARELTVKGQETAALRYVRTAIGLAPQSRFIVRSAARYFLHVGEHERAHNVLLKSPLLRTDPWVQASEIAVATVRGRTSNYFKAAQHLAANARVVGLHLSELVSAVGTVEFLAGSNKKARQLFQKALVHPNDNSLAQVEWAAAKLNLVVGEAVLQTPFSFEANSNNAYRRMALPQAIEFANEWSRDEPFASRPFEALCHLYCLEGRYEDARSAAEGAIRVDDSASFTSQMNLMFTRIQTDDVQGAHVDLLRLAKHPDAKKHSAHILANAGALAYRTGDMALGREFYERSIRAARANGEAHTEALAMAFYARAAALSGDVNAQSIIGQSAARIERLPSLGAIYVIRSLVDQSTRSALEATASARVAKRRWEWESTTNTLRQLE